MSNYSEILSAALMLPPHERDELAQVLHASVADDAGEKSSPVLSDAWQKELARRSAEIVAGTASYSTYEQMRDRARRAAGHDG
jgi:putative addiction module component (TIGR02574 family)